MNQVINQNPDGSQPSAKVTIPNQNVLVAQQVNTLIAISQNAASLLMTVRNLDIENEPKVASTDGGVQAAAEATIIGALAKMDELIADSARWGLAGHDRLEKMLAETYAKQGACFDAAIAESKFRQRPHMLYPPRFIHLPNGQIAVYLGEAQHWDQAIVGVGDSMPEALEAFDAAFVKKVEKKKHEPKPVDGVGSIEVKIAEPVRPVAGADSRDAGPKRTVRHRKTLRNAKGRKESRRRNH